VRSPRFRAWLRRRYYEATADALSAAALNAALDLLEARAQFDGPERTVHVRVAEHDGRIYLDLADQAWRAVEIGPDGWSVVAQPAVRFRRPAGLLPLPIPQPGGSLGELRSFLNLPKEYDLVLVAAWLLATATVSTVSIVPKTNRNPAQDNRRRNRPLPSPIWAKPVGAEPSQHFVGVEFIEHDEIQLLCIADNRTVKRVLPRHQHLPRPSRRGCCDAGAPGARSALPG
jgi:hypothetical protein